MPKYVIERDIPGAGRMTASDLQGVAKKSCGVLREMGPDIKWLHSYVTSNKVYCVYVAPNEEMIREHADKGGFPVTHIERVSTVIDPATEEEAQAV